MTTSPRYIIVDDEALNQTNLHYAIKECCQWQLVGLANSSARAKLLIAQEMPEVIFLDIQMPRESGLVLAAELAQNPQPPLIIFVTAFNEHAIEAFRLHALDYLLKPINDVHLKQAIERAEQMLELRQQANYAYAIRQMISTNEATKEPSADPTPSYWESINVRSIGRIDRIEVNQILWIEAQGNYMRLHLHDRRIMYRASMAHLEKHLDPMKFVRTHRSTIVALDQITSIEVLPDHSYQAHLKNQDIVAISDRHIARVKQLLN